MPKAAWGFWMISHSVRVAELRTSLSADQSTFAQNLLSTLIFIQHEHILTDSLFGRLLVAVDPKTLKEAQDKLGRYALRYGFAKSSIPSYRSRLKKLVEYYQEKFLSVPPAKTEPLGAQIVWFARKVMPKATQLSILEWAYSQSGIPVPTLKRWVTKDSQPRSQHLEGLVMLATLFGLAENYFTERSSSYFVMRALEQAKKQANASVSPREPLPKAPALPDHLQQQLTALVSFKNKARSPSIHQASFSLKRREAPALVGGGRWTSTPDGETASADNFIKALDRYFRWVLANHPVTVAQLDLSLLCTVELLEMYVDDSLEYELYGTLLALLAPLSGLCDPDSGYLVRYHAPKVSLTLGNGHPTENFEQLSEWQAQSRYLNQQIKSWIKDARHLHREGNHDTEDSGRRNINWLLDRPDATLADSVADLRQLVDDLATQPESKKPTRAKTLKQLAKTQVGVWLALSLEVPLRVSNWAAVELFDGTPPRDLKAPVLWFDELNDNYRLRVPRGWLKNRRGRETEQIDTSLTSVQVLGALRQLKALRSELGITGSSLFVQTRNSKNRAIGEPYHRTALAKSIQTWTGRFAFARWPDRGIKNGINPHALRHFVASYILEQTGDYRLAATSLMDSVSVVIAVYGKNDHTTNQRKLAAMQNTAR